MQVSLDLASFEVVRNCQHTLLKLLREGLVDILFCNTAEAEALAEVTPHNGRPLQGSSGPALVPPTCSFPEHSFGCLQVAHVSSAGQENDAVDVMSAASRFLLQHCAIVVVSKGAEGCSAWTRAGQAVHAPAAKVQVSLS